MVVFCSSFRLRMERGFFAGFGGIMRWSAKGWCAIYGSYSLFAVALSMGGGTTLVVACAAPWGMLCARRCPDGAAIKAVRTYSCPYRARIRLWGGPRVTPFATLKTLPWAMESCPFGAPPRINALTEKCSVLAVLFAQATTGVVAPIEGACRGAAHLHILTFAYSHIRKATHSHICIFAHGEAHLHIAKHIYFLCQMLMILRRMATAFITLTTTKMTQPVMTAGIMLPDFTLGKIMRIVSI